jgi:FkbM family methyltransferase
MFPKEKTVTAHVAAKAIADLAPARRTVVQAGGCSGLWPLALAHYFEKVYTFEPEPVNFKCLQVNVSDARNISAFGYALGETRKSVGMTRPKAGAGLWRVDGDGDVDMVPLDGFLGDVLVDAIVLDVEGHEVQAMKGAERLIAAHRPLLWFEYTNNTEAIEEFVMARGYTLPVRGIGGDCYSIHGSNR